MALQTEADRKNLTENYRRDGYVIAREVIDADLIGDAEAHARLGTPTGTCAFPIANRGNDSRLQRGKSHMNSNTDPMQMAGPQRRQALSACLAQCASWGVAVPRVEPLVLDFGLGAFDHTGLIEFWLANEISAGYCGKYLFTFDGQSCPRHWHQFKHETFIAMHGGFEVTLDDQNRSLEPGQSLTIEPGRMHGFVGIGPSLLLELSMPCDVADNFFEDDRIQTWLSRTLAQ